MAKPDIHRLLDLQRFMLQFQNVRRVVYLPGKTDEQENDIEHSYTLAMSAWFLATHFPQLDRDKLIRYALVHDLVEVHAGDTYIFAQDDSLITKQEREHAALQQIKQDWPDFAELATEIEAYEKRSDPESRFVYALDKIMPILVNYIGKGHGWHKHDVSLELLHHNKQNKVALSPEVQDYYDALMALLKENPSLFPASPTSQQR